MASTAMNEVRLTNRPGKKLRVASLEPTVTSQKALLLRSWYVCGVVSEAGKHLQFIHAHNFKIHRQRIKNMRSAIDTAPPEDFLHFQYNAKRAMLQAERLYEIERVRRALHSQLCEGTGLDAKWQSHVEIMFSWRRMHPLVTVGCIEACLESGRVWPLQLYQDCSHE
jgi:Hemingway/CFA97